MTTTKLSQKEYLQKYLSGGSKGTKKKKKKPKVFGNGMKIVDDDIDVSKIRSLEENELELFMDAEEAPQIAGIIDDRNDPSKFSKHIRSEKWKVISQDDGFDSSLKIETVSSNKGSQNDSDLSPPRNDGNDSDLSPDRGKSGQRNRQKGKSSDSDLSPPRTMQKSIQETSSRIKQERKDSDSDLSPPRRKSRFEDDSRRSQHKNRRDNSDLSPLRRKSRFDTESRSKRDKKRDGNDSDLSPPRRKSRFDDPPRTKHNKDGNHSDLSPPRRKSRFDDPPRIKKEPRKRDSDSDLSPDRTSSGRKMEKTLDGKRAGLQNAQQLKNENDEFRRRENEHFSKLSSDMTGRNAVAIKRDLKSGKNRNTEADLEAKKEREERQKILDEKYSRWGKGLKQVQDTEERIKDFIHESSKPLARYKDDVDLDKHLREIERLEDPMLDYMRKKKKNVDTEQPTHSYPTYNGAYPINRFNIRPGYRWDGVDRSNGYEKRYFTMKNSKVANEEESYKWSTEDM